MLRRGIPSTSTSSLTAVEKRLADRASFELAEDDIDSIRTQISSLSGFDAAPSRLHHDVISATRAQSAKEAEYLDWKRKYPNIIDEFKQFIDCAHGKRLAVFLDYDGTLAPIVSNPDEAFMSEKTRDAVQNVAKMYPTAIISGRGREKVEGFVQLKELYYAGSHGLDIVGPREEDGGMSFQPAAKFAPIMDAVFDQLSEMVKQVPRSTVEHNKFCVSVHFRNCDPARYEEVETIVQKVLKHHSGLKVSRGRKVFEIKPKVDWDKGKALQHLLEALELDSADDVMPLYVGDDRTDEDGFKVLRERGAGCGILVSNKAKHTAAEYHLKDPSEVRDFLNMLVEWGHQEGNGWHTNTHCNGWTPQYGHLGRSEPGSYSEFTTISNPGDESVNSEDGAVMGR